jgi:hypothetical protein
MFVALADTAEGFDNETAGSLLRTSGADRLNEVIGGE